MTTRVASRSYTALRRGRLGPGVAIAMRIMRIAVASVLLAACASSNSSTPSGDPPTLQVDTPTRGTTVDGMTVMVSGHVSGGTGAVAVSINGASAALSGDGGFSAQVPLMPGVDIVETHAID